MRVKVRLTPRASREQVSGPDETGVLHVRVCPPPVDGKANQAMIKLLARTFNIPKSSVTIVAGETGRNKMIDLPGLDMAKLKRGRN